jgi:hypothetical protein
MQPEFQKTKSSQRQRKVIERIASSVARGSVFVTGLLFLFGIAMCTLGGWRSVRWLGFSTGLAAAFLVLSFVSMDKGALKASGIIVIVGFVIVLPLFSINQILTFQAAAQNLTTPRENEYFRNLLGRSYNHTELYHWERLVLQWDNSSSVIFYSDPIEIYQHHRARCGGYAILYAELCISQGYQARVVVNIFGDHAWNEIKLNGTWTRVDVSPTGASMIENIGYPLFYEEKWGRPPVFALAFEGSSIVDVTSSYRSDRWSLLSGLTLLFVLTGAWFAVCLFLIWKRVGAWIRSQVIKMINQHGFKAIFIRS